MHTTSNFFQRLSALVAALFVLAATGVAFAGNGASLVPFVPNDAKAVVSIDFAALRSSETLDQLLRNSGAEAQMSRVAGRLDTVGFSPREQIDTALVVANSFESTARPLLIVEGAAIPREAIEAALVREGTAARTTVGTITIYTRGPRGSIAFIGEKTAAIGPTAMVTAAARIAAGQARSTPNSALAREIGRADRSRNLWFAALPPADKVQGTPLAGARAVRGSANIRTSLDMTIDAIMPNAAAAESAATNGRAQLTTMAARDEIAALGLAPVINAVTVAQREESVRLTLALDQARFRRLLTTLVTVIRDQMQ